nr:phage/plasmid primase, P4 family [Nocardia thailandica]
MDEVHRGQARFAYRLANSYGGRLLHVSGIGWHAWDGQRWASDGSGASTRAVLDILRRAMTEGDTELLKDVRKCESSAGINGTLTIAAALDPLTATVTDLDADPYLINVANGILDLRTTALRGHDPQDRLTRVCRAAYRPDAQAPLWTAFLERVLPDPDVRAFVQRLAGVALLGRVVEQILPIFTGTGANGKSVFIAALAYALGDYAFTAEPDLFMARQGAHPTGEMDLMGRRWVSVSESDKGRRLAEATMKRLTGGDTIRARRMHRDFVEFSPSHTAVLVTNHLPEVSGDDEAVWRRLRVVPFDVVIPKGERDPHLSEKLQLEADGIFAWAVQGYAAWIAHGGLGEPQGVLAATDSYRSNSDDLSRFLDECCFLDLKATVGPSELHTRFLDWVRVDGDARPLSLKGLSAALADRGYNTAKSNGRRIFRGIGLLAEDGLL